MTAGFPMFEANRFARSLLHVVELRRQAWPRGMPPLAVCLFAHGEVECPDVQNRASKATSNKGIATSSKDATSSSWHYYWEQEATSSKDAIRWRLSLATSSKKLPVARASQFHRFENAFKEIEV